MIKRLLAILFSVFLAIALLTAATYLLGTSQPVMLALMQECAPPEESGLPEEDYPGMVGMITGYLRGESDEFQYTYHLGRIELPAFQPHEQAHMADCQGLFRVARSVGFGAMGMAAALLAFLMAFSGKEDFSRGQLRRALRTGYLIMLSVLAVAVFLCLVNFEGVFVAFHNLLFSNDLWLLDPNLDMLIRLMPTLFFVKYALLIGGVWLVGMSLFHLVLQMILPKD